MDLLATTFLGYTINLIGYIALVFMWLMIAFLPASIASKKGRSFFLWFVLSIFFWWATIIVALLLSDRSQPTPTNPTAPPSSTQ